MDHSAPGVVPEQALPVTSLSLTHTHLFTQTYTHVHTHTHTDIQAYMHTHAVSGDSSWPPHKAQTVYLSYEGL